jgi:hypothetical protein
MRTPHILLCRHRHPDYLFGGLNPYQVDVEVNQWLKKGPFTKLRKALRDAEWALKPEPPEAHTQRSADLRQWEAAGDDEAAKAKVLAARVDADAAVDYKVCVSV